ncbi:MAG: hypothetical protein KTR28_09310 [Micavibrio sp.]|nr:hypothetical protein [Micavibrio sp.]
MSNSSSGSEHIPTSNHIVPLNHGDIWDIVYHFCPTGSRAQYTPAMGLQAFHDAVCSAFAHIDLPAKDRTRINDFINALQDLYETVAEQDQSAEAFMVEGEDLKDISANLDCLRQVICIQHAELHHHDISSALLWAKTALRRLIKNGWNAGYDTTCALT